jgi:16S rRNA (cytidine1402-2'-O)-methyltransferase
MTLYVVATPVGNLDDIAPRALKVLGEVQAVACEDTRHTGQLLAHFGIRKPLVRYDNFVHRREAPRLLERLRRGESVALVTDAGTPAISDPGFRLVREAAAAGVKVVPVAGPSAVTAALSASGLPADEFTFLGFLPRRPGRVRKAFEAAGAERTVVFLESVFRLKDSLELAREVYGDVEAVVGREISKVHEEFIRGKVGEVLAELAKRKELRGEATVMLAPQMKDALRQAQGER